jgi:hypothetical protein
MNLETLQALLNHHDDGVLRRGAHQPGREFCALEFDSIIRGRKWSDAPITLPDLRPLNDGPWSSDASRTAHLLPVMVALWDWATWTPERKRGWVTRVVILTVQRIISELPTLPDNVREQCRNATTLESATKAAEAAHAAAHAAAYAAEAAHVEAAYAAARAAAYAASAAAYASHGASEAPLITACAIWIHAAALTEE